MAWIQIGLCAKKNLADAYSDVLLEAGALAITLGDAEDKPLFEPPPGTMPLWNQTTVVGLFEADSDIEAVKQFLIARLRIPLDALQIATLADQNWTRAWMDQFHPMKFGQTLWICPSHCEVPDPNALNIFLDPGMAFGTGTHPTTRLCLEWLDAHPPRNAYVIDYGCGSGILGIAALKLGAIKVWAVDYDSQALESTQNNAENNGFTEQQLVRTLPNDFLCPPKTDLILANILADPLIELAPRFAEWLAPAGIVVLSGILAHQAALVSDRYAPWFTNIDVCIQEGWARISAERR